MNPIFLAGFIVLVKRSVYTPSDTYYANINISTHRYTILPAKKTRKKKRYTILASNNTDRRKYQLVRLAHRRRCR
jgi:hypothetical protein